MAVCKKITFSLLALIFLLCSCTGDVTDKVRSLFLTPTTYDIGYTFNGTGSRGEFFFDGDDRLTVQITQSGTLHGYKAEVFGDTVTVSYKDITTENIGGELSMFSDVKNMFAFLAKEDYTLDLSNTTTCGGEKCAWYKIESEDMNFTLWFSLEDYFPIKIESESITLNFFDKK